MAFRNKTRCMRTERYAQKVICNHISEFLIRKAMRGKQRLCLRKNGLS